jgi:hypothetical protein
MSILGLLASSTMSQLSEGTGTGVVKVLNEPRLYTCLKPHFGNSRASDINQYTNHRPKAEAPVDNGWTNWLASVDIST